MPNWLHLVFIGMAVLAGLIVWPFSRTLSFRLFLLFLLYTLLNEGVAYVMMVNGFGNHWLYNIYNYVRFPVLSLVYFYLLKWPVIKKSILFFLITVPLIFLISMYTYKTFYQLHTLTILYGAVFIIFLSIAFLHQLLYVPVEESVFSHPFFWVSSGILFYFLGIVPFLGSINYLSHNHRDLAVQLYDIIRLLNILMYSLFTIAFIKIWIRRKSPTSS